LGYFPGMAAPALKRQVYKRTYPFACGGALLLAWLNLGMPSSPDGMLHVPLPARIASAASLVVMLLVGALDALPGANFKAQLVFGSLRDPLPGARAFERANLDGDPRIDRERLRYVLGGSLPRGAREQNATWYRLYQERADDPRIEHVHYQWLLFRDLTWLTLLLFIAGLIAVAVNSHVRAAASLGAGAAAFLFAIFRRAAAQHAKRFVNTVLALAATAPDAETAE
jgi:hypothetical protein